AAYSRSVSTGAPTAQAAPTAVSRLASDGLSASTGSVGVPRAMSVTRPVSTRPGPTSSTRSAPLTARAAASWNRTGSSTWSRSRLRRSVAGSSTSAVTVDTTGRASGVNSTSASRSVMATAAGSTSGEWNACETLIRVAPRPTPPARPTTRAAASAGPGMTGWVGSVRAVEGGEGAPGLTRDGPPGGPRAGPRRGPPGPGGAGLAPPPGGGPGPPLARRLVQRAAPVQGGQLAQAVPDRGVRG